MSQNSFLTALAQAARPQGSSQAALAVLDEFCQAVQTFTNNAVRCWRVPGFVTNLGQEYRIMLHSTSKNTEHLLLRAHVPAAGFPVKLDLYDENLVDCPTEQKLREGLTQFLQRQTTADVIQTLAA